MPSTLRLQRKRDGLQEEYDLLSEKIRRLHADHAIETGTAVRFQLEKEIKQAEADRNSIEQQIEAIESELEQRTLRGTDQAQGSLPMVLPAVDVTDSGGDVQMTKTRTAPYNKWYFWAAVVAGIVTIVTTIIQVIPFDRGETTQPPTMVVAVVTIKSIKDGEQITGVVDSVHGTYAQVPEDKDVWLVASRGSTCYPMDGPTIKEPTGIWRHGPLDFLDSGQYNLSTVLADANASALLQMAVGKSTGLRCLPDGAEFIETISVEVRTPSTVVASEPIPTTFTPTPMPTVQPTSAPGFHAVGKVCEIEAGSDKNTVFLKQTEFINLGLPRRAKVDIHLEDTEREAKRVTLEVDPDLSTCVVRLSLALRTSLGVAEDTQLSIDQRPERHFVISETPIKVEITSLEAGNPVEWEVPSVSGTYSDIPQADRELWLVVFVGNHYYAQQGPANLLPDNTWSHGTVFFGTPDSGAGKYTLLAVLADEEAVSEFQKHLDGSALEGRLPVGTIVYDQVEVVRSQ